MTLPDDWICPSSERCLCGSICEAREAMDPPEPVFFPGDLSAEPDEEPDQTEETPPAEHTGGNAEDCPVCAPLIDQPGGVLYPWICTAAGEQVIAALPEQAAGPPPG